MTNARNLSRVTKSSDSPFDIILRENGAAISSEGVTRCDLVCRKEGAATVNVSSSADGSWFTLDKPQTVDGRDIEVIEVDLRQTDLDPGVYEVDVFIFDSVNTNGRYVMTYDMEVVAANPSPS